MTSIPHITRTLKESHDTGGGHALRRLLWSMWTNRPDCDTFTGSPVVNLWSCLSYLDEISRLELGQLVAMSETDRERVIREALEESGEWERIEAVPAFGD